MMMMMMMMGLSQGQDSPCCWYAPADAVDYCGACGTWEPVGGFCSPNQAACEGCGGTWCPGTAAPTVTPGPTVLPTPAPTQVPTSTFAPTVASPVSRWGHLQVDPVRKELVSNVTGYPVQLAGMSLYWSNNGWDGNKFWNADVIRELRGWPGLSVIRCSMGVEDPGGYIDDPETNMNHVITVVDAAIEVGLYVIICWHSHDAEAEYVKEAAEVFFPFIAEKYAGIPNVLMAIYNEPEPETNWTTVKEYADDMVPMIRNYSDAVIIVGTPQWCQRPSWVTDLVNGTNIIYGVHMYAAWEGHDNIMADMEKAVHHIPMIVDEWGQGCPHIFCEVNQTKVDWWFNFIDYFHMSHVNWVLNDKQDFVDASLSALQWGASTSGNWTSHDFTFAGQSTYDLIARYEDPPNLYPWVELKLNDLNISNYTVWGPSTDNFTVSEDGRSIAVYDSTWKKVELNMPCVVTETTRLRFYFSQAQQCQFTGIAVTPDPTTFADALLIQISGTIPWTTTQANNAIFDYHDYTPDQGEKFYDILLSSHMDLGSDINYVAFISHCYPAKFGQNDALFNKVELI